MALLFPTLLAATHANDVARSALADEVDLRAIFAFMQHQVDASASLASEAEPEVTGADQPWRWANVTLHEAVAHLGRFLQQSGGSGRSTSDNSGTKAQ
jgi:hypothetical protein